MRTSKPVMVVSALLIVCACWASGQTSAHEASRLFKAVCAAIGGEAKLSAVTSVLLKGKERRMNLNLGKPSGSGEQYVVNSIEFRILFPHHYLCTTTSGGYPWRTGFAGNDLIYEFDLPADHKVVSFVDPSIINEYRAKCARLALLLLMRTDTAIRLNLIPDLAAIDTMRFNGMGEYPLIIRFDKSTHLPLSLQYQVRKHIRVQGPPTGEVLKCAISVDEWRNIGGLRMPHHLTETAGEMTVSEIWFDSIEINPTITAADFKKK